MAEQIQLDPVLLRTFQTVAARRSFTQAAQVLGLAQPTVSQHVRRLEEMVGRQLLNRDTRRVELTDNGEAMAGFARQILSAHDEAVAYFTGSAMAGRLRFGVADELAMTELPGVLREFRRHNPQLNLELTVTQSGTLMRRLEANHLDLVFVNQAADAGRGYRVRRDRLAWAGLPTVQVPRDQPVPLVTYQAPSWSRDVAIQALQAAGRTWRVTCNTREINGVLAAVRAGLGVCVLAKGRIPGDLRQITADLPPLPEVQMSLIDNPRSNKDQVRALMMAVRNIEVTPLGG
ncbi:LysR substrate-binding domain-containing protein [Parenemella sanctibonifatiensis]|uniref:LysR family transcriptional regulator n=1 Tax=Parenemella sanctibonifatiensis TaxID=2016505 RepID=A0A255EKI2_9ACTN|nr:LysR substrate-binding domain-containing protein [Parenemella sanctibonifatiensis]OYN92046.1 LysR family transcriptional regulator [Parenemella sanctibonifatiensis]